MKVTVIVTPPTEPSVELTVSGIKNFQQTGPDSFVLSASPKDLKDLYAKIEEALLPYKQQVPAP